MNERIKELTEQALENSKFETIEPTLTVGEGENKVTIPLVFAEKFAELLEKEFFSAGYIEGRSDGTIETVRECINIALTTKAEQLDLVSDTKSFDSLPEGAKDHSFGRVVAVNQVVANIKEHFGVE